MSEHVCTVLDDVPPLEGELRRSVCRTCGVIRVVLLGKVGRIDVRASLAVPKDEVWVTNGRGGGVRVNVRRGAQ